MCTAHDLPGLRPLDQAKYLANLDALRSAAVAQGLPLVTEDVARFVADAPQP